MICREWVKLRAQFTTNTNVMMSDARSRMPSDRRNDRVGLMKNGRRPDPAARRFDSGCRNDLRSSVFECVWKVALRQVGRKRGYHMCGIRKNQIEGEHQLTTQSLCCIIPPLFGDRAAMRYGERQRPEHPPEILSLRPRSLAPAVPDRQAVPYHDSL